MHRCHFGICEFRLTLVYVWSVELEVVPTFELYADYILDAINSTDEYVLVGLC